MIMASEPLVELYAGPGLVYCSVCTLLTDHSEIERETNRVNPTGVSPWKIAPKPFRDGSANPHPCENGGDRNHYLLVC